MRGARDDSQFSVGQCLSYVDLTECALGTTRPARASPWCCRGRVLKRRRTQARNAGRHAESNRVPPRGHPIASYIPRIGYNPCVSTSVRHPDAGPLVEDIAAVIQADVMEGVIASGTWLRQQAIAEQFGVSRTPVREALQKLETRGVLELVPNRGALVRGPTPLEIRETYRVRAELEGLAAELAAVRIQPGELDELRKASELFGRAIQRFVKRGAAQDVPSSADGTWRQANTRFHEIVHAAAGNDRLRAVIADLHRTFPRNLTWSALRGNPRLLVRNVAEHDAILEAIAAGDPARAREAMSGHVRRSGELVADWFERRPASGGSR